MGQLSSRPNKASNECILEPCTLLSYTTNTAENQPQWVDETPVGCESDGGREEKRRRTRFWKWPALNFPRSAKYDLVQAEKDYQNEAGLYRKLSNIAPTSEVRPAAEEQLKQGILDNGKNNKSMRIRKCYFKLLYKR